MKKVFCATILAALAFGAEGFKIIGKYKVGGEGRWDYVTVDANARRLYVSHGTSIAPIKWIGCAGSFLEPVLPDSSM